jgi:glycosyltransferase involved in cell wall biosynthesis
MPAIAVVMPVFNRATVVGRAIESVLRQDFEDFELIVVDDASTDGTPERIAEIADPRLTLLRQDANAGGNAARNRGILTATAPIVAFLDSDDAYLPHKLGSVVRYFETRPEIDALIDSFERIYAAGATKPAPPAVNPVLETSAEVESGIFMRRIFKATPAVSVRREAAMRAGMFDETLRRRQDFDFVLRLCRTGRCASTDQILWTKIWSDDAISAKHATFMDATIEICRRHPRYLAEPAFRPGLARDTARHFVRLAAEGDFAQSLHDVRLLRRAFGGPALAALMAQGFREIARRSLKRAFR